jgi:hypothetical protein
VLATSRAKYDSRLKRRSYGLLERQ